MSAERVEQLFDFAVSHPDGFTYKDAMAALGWRRSEVYRAVRELRQLFSEDTINLPCDPQGQYEPWRYRLVGTLDEARIWTSNRIGDMESRLETIHAVVGSIDNAIADRRTIEGRKAHKMKVVIGRLIEDLGEIA